MVRIPVILGVNGEDEVLQSAFRFLRDRAPGAALELLPYHRFGEEKYRQLGLPLPETLKNALAKLHAEEKAE